MGVPEYREDTTGAGELYYRIMVLRRRRGLGRPRGSLGPGGKAGIAHRGERGTIHRERGWRLSPSTVAAVALPELGKKTLACADLATQPPGLVGAVTAIRFAACPARAVSTKMT